MKFLVVYMPWLQLNKDDHSFVYHEHHVYYMFCILESQFKLFLDLLQMLDSSGTLLSGDQLKENFEQEGCDYVVFLSELVTKIFLLLLLL